MDSLVLPTEALLPARTTWKCVETIDNNKKNLSVSGDLLHFLKSWLLNHILTEDKSDLQNFSDQLIQQRSIKHNNINKI